MYESLSGVIDTIANAAIVAWQWIVAWVSPWWCLAFVVLGILLDHRRSLAIAIRWLRVVFLTGAGIVVAVAIRRFVPPPNWLDPIVNAAGELLLVGVLAATVLTYSLLYVRPWQFYFAPAYPPVWVAVLGATGTLFALEHGGPGITPLGPIPRSDWMWVIFAQFVALAWLAVSAIVGEAFTTDPERAEGFHPVPSPVEDQDEALTKTLNWVSVEEPIRYPEDDRFRMAALARRFAEHLTRPFDEDRTLGLIGPFGSGKSSVLRLVEHYIAVETGLVNRLRRGILLRRSPHVLVCRIDCWGFDDTGGVLEHILGRIIAQIRWYADATALQSMPGDYHQAVSAERSAWPYLLGLLTGDRGPMEGLRQLTPVLRAINTRLVLVIENLDRGQGGKYNPQDVLALLSRLKESVRGVTYILTGGRTAGFDFAKLCDHIEVIPDPDVEFVTATVLDVCEHCLVEGPEVLSPGFFEENDKFRSDLLMRRIFRPNDIDRNEAPDRVLHLLPLLTNPRVLKQTLRQVLDSWGRLRGEISFLDLLAVTTLKCAAPEVYDYLLRQMDDLRTADTSTSTRLRIAWEQVASVTPRLATTAARVVAHLIPGFAPHLRSSDTSSEQIQGIRHAAPTDYWRRLLAGEVDPELMDQDAIRGIKAWEAEQNKGVSCQKFVTQLVKNKHFRNVVMHLQNPVFLHKRAWLFFYVCERPLSAAKGLASITVLELEPFLTWLGVYGTLYSQHPNLGRIVLRQSVTRSLVFTNEFIEFVKTNAHLDDTKVAELWKDTVTEFRTKLDSGTDYEWLADALNDSHVTALRDFISGPDSQGEPFPYQSPNEWTWAVPHLLGAAENEQHRSKLLPQLARLVFNQTWDNELHISTDVGTVSPRKSVLDALFGPEELATRLWKALAKLARTPNEKGPDKRIAAERLFQIRVAELAAERIAPGPPTGQMGVTPLPPVPPVNVAAAEAAATVSQATRTSVRLRVFKRKKAGWVTEVQPDKPEGVEAVARVIRTRCNLPVRVKSSRLEVSGQRTGQIAAVLVTHGYDVRTS